MSEDKTKRFKDEDSVDNCKGLSECVTDNNDNDNNGNKSCLTNNLNSPRATESTSDDLCPNSDTLTPSCSKTEFKETSLDKPSFNKLSDIQAGGNNEQLTNLKCNQSVDKTKEASPFESKQQCPLTNCDATDKHKPPVLTQNIFDLKKPKDDTSKPSPFLFKQETTNTVTVPCEQPEEDTFIFRKPCTLYKFIKKWEKIGSCTVYITDKDDNKRLYVSREGTMSRPVDVLLNYDCKPYVKRNGVGFITFKEEEGKIVGQNILLVFESLEIVDEFYKMLKK